MDWDLGAEGVGILVGMSVAFGVAAHLVLHRDSTRWLWLIGTGAFFVFGLLLSEVFFGWATEEDLQPNYDGLSFDETLLAIFPSSAAVYLARRALRGRASGDTPEGGPLAPPPSPTAGGAR